MTLFKSHDGQGSVAKHPILENGADRVIQVVLASAHKYIYIYVYWILPIAASWRGPSAAVQFYLILLGARFIGKR